LSTPSFPGVFAICNEGVFPPWRLRGFSFQIKARLYVLTYSQNGDDKNIKTQKAATYVGTKK